MIRMLLLLIVVRCLISAEHSNFCIGVLAANIICSGDYYFQKDDDGNIKMSFPPFDIVCDSINGSLTIKGYDSSQSDYIPRSIRSLKSVNGTLLLQNANGYPSFLNTINKVGTLRISDTKLDNTWLLGQIKVIFEALEIIACENAKLSFPNLVELGNVIFFRSSINSIDIPNIYECGAVYIDMCSGFYSLFMLKNIKKVKGYLLVFGTPLTSLGMDSLTTVTGTIDIDNISSDHMDVVFPNGINIGGDLDISLNDAPVVLKTVKGSTNIRGSVRFAYNTAAIDASGLDPIYIGKSIAINDNERNITMFDVSNISHQNGSILIYNNKEMDYLQFPSLVSIQEDFAIPQIMKQQDTIIPNFPKLSNVQGVVRVIKCDLLTNLNVLKSLDYFGSLSIVDNSNLKTLEGIIRINTLESLTIQGNNNLKTLEGLNNIVSINGELRIYANQNLASTRGFVNLKHVEEIMMNMMDQRKLKQITFGKKGSNLGFPHVKIRNPSWCEYLTLNDIKKSFASICLRFDTIGNQNFECNEEQAMYEDYY